MTQPPCPISPTFCVPFLHFVTIRIKQLCYYTLTHQIWLSLCFHPVDVTALMLKSEQQVNYITKEVGSTNTVARLSALWPLSLLSTSASPALCFFPPTERQSRHIKVSAIRPNRPSRPGAPYCPYRPDAAPPPHGICLINTFQYIQNCHLFKTNGSKNPTRCSLSTNTKIIQLYFCLSMMWHRQVSLGVDHPAGQCDVFQC